MRYRLTGPVCGLALMVAFSSAHAHVTFDAASAYAGALAQASGPMGYQQGYDPQQDAAYSFTAMPLRAESNQAVTEVEDGVVQAAASDGEIVTAAFASPSSGSFTLTGRTSAVADVQGSQAVAENQESSGTYVFSLDAPSEFVVTSAYDDDGGYRYYSGDSGYILASSDDSFYAFTRGLDRTTTTDTYLLAAGDYEFQTFSSVYSDSVGTMQPELGLLTGSEDDTYTFSISAAPEPSAWTLMIAGVGLVGCAFRCARRKVRALSLAVS